MLNKIYLCSECGKLIEGDHVYINTRRGMELHIHHECVPRKCEKKSLLRKK